MQSAIFKHTKWILSKKRIFLLCIATAFFLSAFGQNYPNIVYQTPEVIGPGTTWQRATNANPSWNINIIRVDLSNRNIQLRPEHRERESFFFRPSFLAIEANAIAATNGTFFGIWGPGSGHPAEMYYGQSTEFCMIDGQLLAPNRRGTRPVWGIAHDGSMVQKSIDMHWGSEPLPSEPGFPEMIHALGGRPALLEDGVKTGQPRWSSDDVRHPRTMMSWSNDNQFVYLVTVDGNNAGGSVGMTWEEQANLLLDLGCDHGINFDGGGSTTAWVNGQIVNVPSDGSERGGVTAMLVIPAYVIDHTDIECTQTGNWQESNQNDTPLNIESWFYVQDVDKARYQFIAAHCTSDHYIRLYIYYSTDLDQYRVRLQLRDTDWKTETFDDAVHFNDGEGWYHLRLEITGSEGKVYLNGNHIGTNDWSEYNPNVYRGSYGVGQYIPGTEDAHQLYFDDFRVYKEIGGTQQVLFEESFGSAQASHEWSEWRRFGTGGTIESVQLDTDWLGNSITPRIGGNGYFGKIAYAPGSASNIWLVGSVGPDFYNTSGLLASAGEEATITWRPDLEMEGQYRIYAWYTAGADRPSSVDYTVHDFFGTHSVTLNQQTGGGEWELLGNFVFSSGDKGYVQLENNAVPGEVLSADAMKFVWTGRGFAEYIIDNMDSANRQIVGSWSTGTYPTPWGENYHFAYAGDGSSTFSFFMDMPVKGTYEVYSWWVAGTNRATNARYRIHHSEGIETLYVNQQQNGSAWNLLGTYFYEEGDEGRVVIDNSGNNVVMADAVKFTLIEIYDDDDPAFIENWELYSY